MGIRQLACQLGSPPHATDSTSSGTETRPNPNRTGFLLASNRSLRAWASEVDDVVRDGDQFLVVTGAHDACAGVRVAADRVCDEARRRAVWLGCRRVEGSEAGIARQSPSQREALALPTRQRSRG